MQQIDTVVDASRARQCAHEKWLVECSPLDLQPRVNVLKHRSFWRIPNCHKTRTVNSTDHNRVSIVCSQDKDDSNRYKQQVKGERVDARWFDE
jgi:hypothetical protein